MGCVIGRIHMALDILLPSIIIIVQDYSQALNTYKCLRVSCGGVFNMLLVLSITFYFYYNIWGCSVQLAHFSSRWLKGYIYSSCYYHHQIGSIHLSHCYYIFRGCVPEMFVTSYSVTYCICVPGKPGICFHYYCAVYDECKCSDTFWLADRTRLFVQYIISLSSLCKLIWRHWTYKMPVRYILSSVWVRLSKFSPLSIIQYVGLYVFSLPISVMMIERIYILCLIIIIKSELWIITHCLGLGHETMVSAVCRSILLSYHIKWCHIIYHTFFCVLPSLLHPYTMYWQYYSADN